MKAPEIRGRGSASVSLGLQNFLESAHRDVSLSHFLGFPIAEGGSFWHIHKTPPPPWSTASEIGEHPQHQRLRRSSPSFREQGATCPRQISMLAIGRTSESIMSQSTTEAPSGQLTAFNISVSGDPPEHPVGVSSADLLALAATRATIQQSTQRASHCGFPWLDRNPVEQLSEPSNPRIVAADRLEPYCRSDSEACHQSCDV